MCKWGTDKEVEVTIVARLSSTGKDKRKVAKIDACIADIVEALDKGGMKMTASCCGHNKWDGDGYIDLDDGRMLIIRKKDNSWKYERCSKCFRNQRLAWSVTDELWNKVITWAGSRKDIFCLECFLKIADGKNIKVRKEDFRYLGWIGNNDIGDVIIDR